MEPTRAGQDRQRDSAPGTLELGTKKLTPQLSFELQARSASIDRKHTKVH